MTNSQNSVPQHPTSDQLHSYLLGENRDAEPERIEDHLETCAECQTALETLLTELRPLDSSASIVSTPEELLSHLKELPNIASRDEPTETTAEDTGPNSREVSTPLPESIGRYQIKARLGVGGMGTVYRARDPQLDRYIALKVPHFDGLPEQREKARQRFLREARAAAQVRHPHICPLYDVGEHEGQPFVVMALVEGGTLAERLSREGPFANVRDAVSLIRKAAEGLAAVHQQNILHRDLKPANILLENDGSPLLTDFGLARDPNSDEAITASGAVVGTPAFMAPEQADPTLGPMTVKSDVYSLGVVLYEMLTGRRPYQGSATAVLGKIGREKPPSLLSLRPDLPASLANIVEQAMARRAEDRYADAAEFAAALRRWLDGTTTESELPSASRIPQHRPKILVGCGATIFVLFLLAGLIVIARPWQSWFEKTSGTAPLAEVTDSKTDIANNPTKSEPLLLKGTITMRVWGESPQRQGVPLEDLAALPLRKKDHVRIEASLNQPAYLYVLLIDTQGKVQPIYPWEPGDWSQRPTEEHPRKTLRMPEEQNTGFPVNEEDPTGMETLMLLARRNPLPEEIVGELQKTFQGLPRQKEQNLRAAVWFENGQVISINEPKVRGFGFDVKRIDDPVLKTQELLRTKLSQHFDYVRAVSYPLQGK